MYLFVKGYGLVRIGILPELGTTTSGKKVLEFRGLVPEYDAQGKEKDEPTGVNILVFGAQAEFVKAHLSVGRIIYVEGFIQERKWTDRETGQRKSRTVLNASRPGCVGVRFADYPKQGNGNGTKTRAPEAEVVAGPSMNTGDDVFQDGDLEQLPPPTDEHAGDRVEDPVGAAA